MLFYKGKMVIEANGGQHLYDVLHNLGYKSEEDIAIEARQAEKRRKFERFKVWLGKNKDRIVERQGKEAERRKALRSSSKQKYS